MLSKMFLWILSNVILMRPKRTLKNHSLSISSSKLKTTTLVLLKLFFKWKLMLSTLLKLVTIGKYLIEDSLLKWADNIKRLLKIGLALDRCQINLTIIKKESSRKKANITKTTKIKRIKKNTNSIRNQESQENIDNPDIKKKLSKNQPQLRKRNKQP